MTIHAAAFNQGEYPTIAFVNRATAPLDVDLDALVAALAKQLDQDFVPIWGYPARLYVTQNPRPDEWQIVFLDDAKAAEGLGYHEITKDGQPISKVFVRTTKAAGEKVSVTTSHELLEMLIDPGAQLWAQRNDGKFYAYEMCDAVEEEEYAIDGIAVSDFVYPSFFEWWHASGSVRFDHLGRVSRPFETLKKGYQIVSDGHSEQEIFGSRDKERHFRTAEDRTMHRSEYRKALRQTARSRDLGTLAPLSPVRAYERSLESAPGTGNTAVLRHLGLLLLSVAQIDVDREPAYASGAPADAGQRRSVRLKRPTFGEVATLEAEIRRHDDSDPLVPAALDPPVLRSRLFEAREIARDEIDAEIARRTREHQAVMARLRAPRLAAGRLAKAAPQPLVMLAHGDSWFDYPLNGNGLSLTNTDIIAQLGKLGAPAPLILNISHHGDATTDEMAWPKQQRMIDSLQDPANWAASGKPDAILFSGGGDDIAGDQFCIYLDDATKGATGLDDARFGGILGSVEASYHDLFAFRDRRAPGAPIFGHCYDFPVPNGEHPACAGPWLKPSLDFCGWDLEQGTAIVRMALQRFRAMLAALAADPANNFVLVDTQGVLKRSEWANELHPYPGGFGKIAAAFVTALRGRFAGRI